MVHSGLSPFLLGPVALYQDHVALRMENGWQYSKVYPEHLDEHGDPSQEYFRWAKTGWAKNRAERHPMGKLQRPAYSWWDGRKLGYIDARKQIYLPLYAIAVARTKTYAELKEMYQKYHELILWDYDAYDHRAVNMSYTDVLNRPDRIMGHAFILAMMLQERESVISYITAFSAR